MIKNMTSAIDILYNTKIFKENFSTYCKKYLTVKNENINEKNTPNNNK